MVRLNVDMPPEPFMKMAAKEVLTLRKKVKEMQEEIDSLTEENDMLLKTHASAEETKKLRDQVGSLKGMLKESSLEKRIETQIVKNRALRVHTMQVAKRCAEAISKDVPLDVKYLLELAYVTGFADDECDFFKFYNDVKDELREA